MSLDTHWENSNCCNRYHILWLLDDEKLNLVSGIGMKSQAAFKVSDIIPKITSNSY